MGELSRFFKDFLEMNRASGPKGHRADCQSESSARGRENESSRRLL
jgi:hypothetical protein